jgi:dephospho-CoA kinase
MNTMKNKTVIGITGYPCVGKSLVSKMLRDKGALVFDFDQIGHQVIEMNHVKDILVNKFTNKVLNDDGKIKRKHLAELAFRDRGVKNFLEELIHPMVLGTVVGTKIPDEFKIVVYDTALLSKTGLSLDFSWLITSSMEKRVERLKDRGWSVEELNRRNSMQPVREEDLVKLKMVSRVITNDGSVEELRTKVESCLVQDTKR